MEVMDIIFDRIGSNEIIYMFEQKHEILSNELFETENPTIKPSPEPITVNEYKCSKRLIFKLPGDYIALTQRNIYKYK